MKRKSKNRFRNVPKGFTVVELLVATGIIAVLMALLVPAVQQARETSRHAACANNLRQLAVACHQFEGTYRVFPPGHLGPPISLDDIGEAQQQQDTWTGHLGFLFPYVEQSAIYNSLDPILWNRDVRIGPAWFLRSEVIHQMSQNRLSILQCPSDGDAADAKSIPAIQPPSVLLADEKIQNGRTSYLGCSGIVTSTPDGDVHATGVFYSRSKVRAGEISDGLSTTLLFGEVLGEAPEEHPETITHRHAVLCGAIPVDNFWLLDDTYDRGPSHALIFRSRHNMFVNMAFADGSVHKISANMDRDVLKALASISGGEVVDSGF